MHAVATEAAPPRQLHAKLAAYGIVLALVTVLGLSAINTGPIILLGTRAAGIAAAEQVLDEGGPPLAERSHGRYVAAGVTDDQGIYLYGSLLGHVTGERSPGVLVKWIWLGLFAITIAIAPITYYRAFGSMAAAVLTPLALALLIASFGGEDIYWIVPWALVTLLPWVLLLAKRWPRHAVWIVAAIGLAASFATSIRAAAGLPVVLATAFVVLRAPTRWAARFATLGVLVLAYLAITPLGFTAVRSYRDHEVHADLAKGKATSHSLWHNTYIGLGFLPNRWRIQYRDKVSIAAVEQTKPDAPFLSPAYNNELRRLFGHAIAEDPSYFARESLQKVVATIGHTARYLAVAALCLAALAALGLLGPIRMTVLLTLPALLLAIIPPILVMPMRSYELGFYGAVGVVALAAIAILADPLVNAVRARKLPTGLSWQRPAAAAALVIFVLAVAWGATRNIDSRSAEWQARHLAPAAVP